MYVQKQQRISSLQAVVASGIYHSTSCNMLVPMDIALNHGDRRESDNHRMDKIIKKIGEGNFAKVLQKVRAVLRPRRQLRSELVARC
jgi:hypothetical protein